jgi:hypothetical protein
LVPFRIPSSLNKDIGNGANSCLKLSFNSSSDFFGYAHPLENCKWIDNYSLVRHFIRDVATLSLRLKITLSNVFPTVFITPSVPSCWAKWQFMSGPPTIPLVIDSNLSVMGNGGLRANHFFLFFCISIIANDSRRSHINMLFTCRTEDVTETCQFLAYVYHEHHSYVTVHRGGTLLEIPCLCVNPP